MDENKKYLWVFVSVSAGLHLALGGVVWYSARADFFFRSPEESVIHVELVGSVGNGPESSKVKKEKPPFFNPTIVSYRSGKPKHEIRNPGKLEEGDLVDVFLEKPTPETARMPSTEDFMAGEAGQGFSPIEPAGREASGSEPVGQGGSYRSGENKRGGAGISGEGAARFLQIVRDRLDRAKRYPWLARIQGQEGTVRVQFMINASGEIQEIHLLESSKSKILDEEAVRTVKRMGRFSRLPISWNENVQIQVPLVFQLNPP